MRLAVSRSQQRRDRQLDFRGGGQMGDLAWYAGERPGGLDSTAQTLLCFLSSIKKASKAKLETGENKVSGADLRGANFVQMYDIGLRDVC